MDDMSTATSPDTPRPVATDTGNDVTLSLEEASELYAEAGHPRTLRRLAESAHVLGAVFEASNASRYPRAIVRTPRPMSS